MATSFCVQQADFPEGLAAISILMKISDGLVQPEHL